MLAHAPTHPRVFLWVVLVLNLLFLTTAMDPPTDAPPPTTGCDASTGQFVPSLCVAPATHAVAAVPTVTPTVTPTVSPV